MNSSTPKERICMGGGTRYGRDQPKAAAVDLVADSKAAVAVAGGVGGVRDAEDVCELVRRVGFEVEDDDVLPKSGAPIALRRRGRALWVYLAGGSVVGQVADPAASLLNNCVGRGYLMEGTIESIDPHRRVGFARLRGIKT
jgi:hypothetical protein